DNVHGAGTRLQRTLTFSISCSKRVLGGGRRISAWQKALPGCSQPAVDRTDHARLLRTPRGSRISTSWQVLREDLPFGPSPLSRPRTISIYHILISIDVFHSFHTVLLILDLNNRFVPKETILFLKYLVNRCMSFAWSNSAHDPFLYIQNLNIHVKNSIHFGQM
uniref:Uncharacterized protein n=1 Tax=Sus scrofa TaxID=9823 RepID=A0A4X1ST84_PIG